MTFVEFKTHIKIELAKDQLTLTHKSFELISQELGYKDVSNFYRNFKLYTGMTPKDYRETVKLLDNL